MEKHYLIDQPPLSDKYRLLVNEMNQDRRLGYTNDIDKVLYNIKVLGENFSQTVTIKNMFTDKGSTTVHTAGRFIIVLMLNKEHSIGEMTFFDFNINAESSGLLSNLRNKFSDQIADAWMERYYWLRSSFLESDDRFELFVPDES